MEEPYMKSQELTFVNHLGELRKRLIITILAFIVLGVKFLINKRFKEKEDIELEVKNNIFSAVFVLICSIFASFLF
jgi:Sec-independent protein secretion pathway component TatC